MKPYRDEPVRKEKLGHRKVDWSQQLDIVVQDIQVQGVHKNEPQDLLHFSGYKHDRRLGHNTFERWAL